MEEGLGRVGRAGVTSIKQPVARGQRHILRRNRPQGLWARISGSMGPSAPLALLWGSAPGRRAVGSAGRRKAAGWGIEELFISYSD